MFFLLLLYLFGATADYCNICAWPHVGTLNMRGQCVIGVGYQPNLDATCTNWCLLQNESSMAIPTVLISPSKSSTGYQCVCDWRDENDNLQYITRPANSCPSSVLGPSDEVLAQNYSHDAAADAAASSSNANADGRAYEDYSYGEYATGSGNMGGHVDGFINGEYVTLNLEAGMSPLNLRMLSQHITNAAQGEFAATALRFDPRFDSVDAGIRGVRDSLATSLAVSRNSATGEQLSGVENDLMYAINSRTGGSGSGISSTDLSNAFGRVASSLDSLRSAMSSDSGSPEGTNLSGVISGIRSVKTSVDSGVQSVVRDAMDREHRALYSDSAAHWAYMDYLDSVYSAGSGGSGGGSGVSASDGIGFLTDSSSRAGSALSSFLNAVNNITNVSSSCSDGHIPYDNVDVTVWGKYEIKVDFSQIWSNHVFQGVLSFMRLMAALTGAIGGLLSALSVFAWLSSRTGVSRFEGGSIGG